MTRDGQVVGPMGPDTPVHKATEVDGSWRSFHTDSGKHLYDPDLDIVAEYTPEEPSSRDSFNLDMKDTPANDAVGSNISPTFMRATEIAGRAADLVGGDRDRQHGAKKDNFERIATMWNAWLKTRRDPAAPLSAFDVGILMVLMKAARTQSGSLNIDDFIDAAGYAACAGEIAQLDLTA